ncbi:MAG TPA: diguanylate cyclase [Pyrinomonadaceae bacterium]|nr:diguanylate cyclase [Pyrinomonadaceae bacterium]
MLSLYNALLAQHSRQLTPLRCAEQTIVQLHRYFEDVVLENSLAALVVESLPLAAERSMRDFARVREVGRAARHAFFFVSPEDGLNHLTHSYAQEGREPVLIKWAGQATLEERFVVIADARFSALLASVHSSDADGSDGRGDEVIWTFEPDIVYSALEYLMARVAAENSLQSSLFSLAVRTSVPKTTSLQLTVSVTTKLARLLQEQAVREVAVNRIATAIRSTLDLSGILQTTVDEVGRALGAQHCALSVEGEHGGEPLVHCHFRDGEVDEAARDELVSDLGAYAVRLRSRLNCFVRDGVGGDGGDDETARPLAAVPLIFRERQMGVLMVCSDDPRRAWQENELLLMRTVADQVAVAVNHARLFQETQQQALTDGLTACPNRRSFEMQLVRDLHMATRMRQPLSLIMLDVDHFKGVNDTHGHAAGDLALRMLADAIRQELRGEDTAARYGGEEFSVILPQASYEGAMAVAERLRTRIEFMEVPGVRQITASFGVATFPTHGDSRDLIVTAADRALYRAKNDGRNCVRGAAEEMRNEEARAEDVRDEETRDEEALGAAMSDEQASVADDATTAESKFDGETENELVATADDGEDETEFAETEFAETEFAETEFVETEFAETLEAVEDCEESGVESGDEEESGEESCAVVAPPPCEAAPVADAPAVVSEV